MTPVTSSNLAGYEYEGGYLRIQFKSGHVFQYANVPEKLVTAFEEAPSKGSFYAHEIRRQFPSEKITGNCPKCGDLGVIGATCDDCGCSTYTDQKGPA